VKEEESSFTRLLPPLSYIRKEREYIYMGERGRANIKGEDSSSPLIGRK